ncbi:hypothetical protein [Scatolibacter rhodanostii]|uniref:hypothetical protein n=1 Tax=Scatolibacter rhodanostii TaxID=2014781 RepID=UPI000C0867AF|nr:hypothetical protein [Scatolibacter rhodanostii]
MRKYPKRKEPVWPKLFLGIITILQLGLTIMLHVMNRQDTLKVIQKEDEMTVINRARQETKKVK